MEQSTSGTDFFAVGRPHHFWHTGRNFRRAASGDTFAPHVTFNMQGLYAFTALCLALLGRNTW